MTQANPNWIRQTSWTIDPSGGDDGDDGSASNPIQTFAELQRRWGPRPRIADVITINLLGDADEDVVLSADVEINSGGRIELVGTPSTVVSGATVATAQALSYSTGANGQDARITSGGIASFAVHTFASTGRRIYRPSDGAYGWVVSTVGGVANGRITRMARQIMAPGPTSLIYSDLAASDVIDIQQLPRINTLKLDVHGLDLNFAQSAVSSIVSGIWISDQNGVGTGRTTIFNRDGFFGTSANPLFLFCALTGTLNGGSAIFSNCGLPNNFENMVTAILNAGGAQGLQFRDCARVAVGDTVCSYNGVGFNILDRTSFNSKTGQIGSFDGTNGIAVDVSSVAVVKELFGSGSSGYGSRINGRAYYQSGTTPKATGTLGDTAIGQVVVANGSLPNINANNNAAFVVEPV